MHATLVTPAIVNLEGTTETIETDDETTDHVHANVEAEMREAAEDLAEVMKAATGEDIRVGTVTETVIEVIPLLLFATAVLKLMSMKMTVDRSHAHDQEREGGAEARACQKICLYGLRRTEVGQVLRFLQAHGAQDLTRGSWTLREWIVNLRLRALQ